jgi:hypothetical protein
MTRLTATPLFRRAYPIAITAQQVGSCGGSIPSSLRIRRECCRDRSGACGAH